MEIKNKKFSVLGVGKSGLSVARKIKTLGGEVFLSEYKKQADIPNYDELKEDFVIECGGHTQKVLESEIIIISPGIPSNIPIIKQGHAKNIEVISEIEFGYRILSEKAKLIAVTGSNGKSTTVTLINHFLKEAGFKTLLAGNIGTAFTDYPIEEDIYDFIVLEISSFQLENISNFRADVAIILNITPDHLNRYDTFADYAKTKLKIFNNQDQNNKAIVNLDDKYSSEMLTKLPLNKKYFSIEKTENSAIYAVNNVIKLADSSLNNIDFKQAIIKGNHNLSNTMAAILAVEDYISDKAVIERGLRTFKPLENRMEFVGKINSISFINDSKATNTMSVKSALETFEVPLNIILGGSDKGEDFSLLVPLLKEKARSLHLIGETKEKMLKDFKKIDSSKIFVHDSFKQAIQQAYKQAEKNDIVILSPACASYDMFKNFEVRGKTFKDIAKGIISNG